MNEGQVIGPYVVGRELGRGAMGVVHFATDSRLGRSVAIKALPDHLIADPERLARFDREARALASVSHPNIAAIYGVEELDGRKCLILEYVDGETLADRLDRGAIPPEDALDLCAQIAAGVEAAHEAGVVHRDLKPANIRITSDGRAKVLDFGLAKTSEASSASTSSPEPAATLPPSQTVPGAVLGTAPYMSPEQARGRKVDQRSDIWSFGAIFYECLTGAGPFVGETMTDTLGAILHKEPDWSRLPPDTPPTVQILLRRCLQRDRSRRLQSIGDARVELQAAIDDPSGSVLMLAGEALTRRRRRSVPLLAAVLGALVLAALAAALAWTLRPRATPTVAQLSVSLPPSVTDLLDIAVAPDGSKFAIVGLAAASKEAESTRAIYMRRVQDRDFHEIPGTTGAHGIRFSPSGDRLFFVRGQPGTNSLELASMPAAGGPILSVIRGDASSQTALWGFAPLNDDTLVVPSADARRLLTLSTAGGALHEVHTSLPDGQLVVGLVAARAPYVLAITIKLDKASEGVRPSLFRINLESGATDLLLETVDWNVGLAPGNLVFLRDGSVYLAPFDARRAAITGPAHAAVSNVDVFTSASATPCILFVPKRASAYGLVAVGPDGASESLLESKDECAGVAVSPDGRRIAFARSSQTVPPAAYTLDITSRLTRVVSAKGEIAINPTWLPDGRLTYVRPVDALHSRLMVIDSATGAATLFLPEGVNAEGISVSPDGRHAIVDCRPSDGRESGLYGVDLDHPETLRLFFSSPGEDANARFSPDGKWVAYTTDANGRTEAYLRQFDPERPDSPPIHPISREGGVNPVWSRDGKSLYFVGGPKSDRLFGVTIDTEPALTISAPKPILEKTISNEFDVLPDGHFVFARHRSPDERPDLRILVNLAHVPTAQAPPD